jgi:hypothetical protein
VTVAPNVKKRKSPKTAKAGRKSGDRSQMHVGDTVVEGNRQGTPAILKRMKAKRAK